MTHTTSEPMLQELGQVAITVMDLARAKEFYQERLGLAFLFDAGTMAFFQCGSVRLLIGEAAEMVPSKGTILYFRVSNLETTSKELESRGVEFEQPPHLVARMKSHDLWLAFVKDPSGNVLGLMSEVARA